jgi:NAD(P)-dependent dehydrogenase (short-subunit alcohol dehydrogenase family)
MNDAPRYRLNAADCLSAGNTCHSDHRSLLLSIAGSWYALARQDEATRDLLASWGVAEPIGTPKDVADVVIFLAGEDSRWVTGQNIQAGGGVVWLNLAGDP